MATMDVRGRIRKTGEERIYPEKVFEVICDDPDNPVDFIEYVDIPKDNAPVVQAAEPQATHQQILVDELIKTRNEKLALEAELKELKASLEPEQEKKKVGRLTKEKETV